MARLNPRMPVSNAAKRKNTSTQRVLLPTMNTASHRLRLGSASFLQRPSSFAHRRIANHVCIHSRVMESYHVNLIGEPTHFLSSRLGERKAGKIGPRQMPESSDPAAAAVMRCRNNNLNRQDGFADFHLYSLLFSVDRQFRSRCHSSRLSIFFSSPSIAMGGTIGKS